jgi:hypothetical protein
MPYRRIPNSDSNLGNALRVVLNKANSTHSGELAISLESYASLQSFYPGFQKAIDERAVALSGQTTATRERTVSENYCRLIISHFIQVFNLGVARKKYRAADRGYLGLDIKKNSLPNLIGEANLRNYAEFIINGDVKRVNNGGAEMSNPARQEVEDAYRDFVLKLNEQSNKKDIFQKKQKDVDVMRSDAKELVRELWNEIEFYFRKDETSSLRRKAREYGVVYKSWKGEQVVEEEQTGTQGGK